MKLVCHGPVHAIQGDTHLMEGRDENPRNPLFLGVYKISVNSSIRSNPIRSEGQRIGDGLEIV